MYRLLRRILFLLAPEQIHSIMFALLKIRLVQTVLRLIYHRDYPQLSREVFGLQFPNPVGLAAGFDKNADVPDAFAAMGFGFVEIGTVTPLAQPGNPQPRLIRLKKDRALINRMGFNNEGVETAVANLKRRRSTVLIGGNIGKNKITANENALNDYRLAFEALYPVVDYFVVNVSSPNTPGLRELQEREPLKKILGSLQQLNAAKVVTRPILLKIAPDLTDSQLDDIIAIVAETGIAGVIATNTTVARDGLKTDADTVAEMGAGGLSGAPLRQRSTEVIRYLVAHSGDAFPVIAAGGIMSAEDALEKLDAGAKLVQIYTGLVYEGPALIKRINHALLTENTF